MNKTKSINTKPSGKKRGRATGIKSVWRKVSRFFANIGRKIAELWSSLAEKLAAAFSVGRTAATGIMCGVMAFIMAAVVVIAVFATPQSSIYIPLPPKVYIPSEDEALAAMDENWQVVSDELTEEEMAMVIEAAEHSGEVTTEYKYGYTGAEVIEIQERLMELDYMDNDEPTEYYGPQTRYAIELFQRKNKLQEDGVAGEQTRLMLFSEDAKIYTVSIGITGTDVLELQKRLKTLGYISKATSYFGTDTETAVKAFQKRNGLSADGNVGPATREVLYSSTAKAAAGKSAGKKTTTSVGDSASVSALISEAKSHLGATYVRGGKGPNSFDCSGFVYYCLNAIGVKISYRTSSMWASDSSFGYVGDYGSLQAGDIICVTGHVGIYLGGGQVIDASSGQGCVRITDFGNWWKRNWKCAKRVL